MKKTASAYLRLLLYGLIALPVFFTSCYKAKIQFGQDLVDDSYSNIVLVDTLTAQLSTVYTDSVPTSGSGALLAGSYADPAFGRVTAKSFFEIIPPAITTVANNATYDSIVFIAIPNKTYYGDTSFASTFYVNQLINQINFPLNQTQFFNTTDFPINTIPLGSITKVIAPNNTDSLNIRLSDNAGQQLFSLFQSDDYVMQSANNFIPYFKGLQLSSDTINMHAIYGFKDSAVVRIYYHEPGLFSQNKTLDFAFYNRDNTQFNQVISNRSGTALSAFHNGINQIAASALNNKAYMQYLTGFLPKITFPSIRDLLLRPDFARIIQAQLIIKPLQGSYLYPYFLPPSLLAYTTDQLNGLGAPLLFPAASGYQNGNLVIDPLYGQNTAYTYDVTAYLQQQITIGYSNQNGLLLAPPSPASITTFNRLIIGDPINNAAVQLKLYYVSITP